MFGFEIIKFFRLATSICFQDEMSLGTVPELLKHVLVHLKCLRKPCL